MTYATPRKVLAMVLGVALFLHNAAASKGAENGNIAARPLSESQLRRLRGPADKKKRAAEPTACQYGTIPGALDLRRPIGSRWQLASDQCKLKNYLQYYIPSRAPAQNAPPVSILYMSDSNDHFTVKQFCRMVRGKLFADDNIMYQVHHHKYNGCQTDRSRLTIRQVYLPSITEMDPVVMDPTIAGVRRSKLRGFRYKMKLARTSWDAEFPGTDPDAVVVAAGLWDILRWCMSPPDALAAVELTYRSSGREMSNELMVFYMRSARAAIAYAKELFPRSKVMWRNWALPSWNRKTGTSRNDLLGNKDALVKLKAAGWGAAGDEGLERIDVAAMTEAFLKAEHYLEDTHHLRSDVRMEVVNIVLNVILRTKGIELQDAIEAQGGEAQEPSSSLLRGDQTSVSSTTVVGETRIVSSGTTTTTTVVGTTTTTVGGEAAVSDEEALDESGGTWPEGVAGGVAGGEAPRKRRRSRRRTKPMIVTSGAGYIGSGGIVERRRDREQQQVEDGDEASGGEGGSGGGAAVALSTSVSKVKPSWGSGTGTGTSVVKAGVAAVVVADGDGKAQEKGGQAGKGDQGKKEEIAVEEVAVPEYDVVEESPFKR